MIDNNEINVIINMPHVFEVGDYHEFNKIKNIIQEIMPYHTVKVEEVLWYDCYIGIAYLKGQEKIAKQLIEELKEAYKEEE